MGQQGSTNTQVPVSLLLLYVIHCPTGFHTNKFQGNSIKNFKQIALKRTHRRGVDTRRDNTFSCLETAEHLAPRAEGPGTPEGEGNAERAALKDAETLG